ncbi:MAG TPA: DUF885 domain-containing protein [Gammaproteobacteria bacterium]|nr:DUF885 domain-containing protein [Gammaproteobacteria bacterium]
MPKLTRPLAATAGALLVAACAFTPDKSPTLDEAFATYSARFVEELMAFYPEWGIYAGHYAHAATLTIPDAARRAAELDFAERHLAELDKFDLASLSPAHRTDLALIRNELEATRWSLTAYRGWSWNPAEYNVAGPFALLINTDYAPFETRLRTVLARLERVPDYYAAARASIETPTLEHVRLAIQQNQGALGVFGDDLIAKVEASALSADEKTLFKTRVAAARAAIGDYISWLKELEQRYANGGARSFRLGEALYEPLFAYQIQSGYTARELYERALAEKERLHARMAQLASELWPKYMGDEPPPSDRLELIGRLIAKLSERHVAREELFAQIKRQIPLLESFVAERQLLTQDPTKPLIVRETPEYMRGVAGASINAPGPFNPNAETYYNVTPLDHYTPEMAESYLREYNHWILQILNIHEAIPGHYTQLVHANKSPSVIKSLLGNGAMVEGWAVYAERMMLENGWGGHEPEMWLMYGKWNLRVVCNTILDYGVHVLGMSQEEALKLLTKEAFQTEAEAREKWRRVTLTHVQLTSYFAGYAEIYDFREQQKRALGERFDLRTFHDRFLSYGNAPIKVIRELMTSQP